jgi:DNA-binding PadR family transcriptional regulator
MIKQEMRVRNKTHAVLMALSVEAHKALYGLEIYDRTGLLPGTTYPILLRLQTAGRVRAYWAEADPCDPQQARRRYYQITALGVRAARTTTAGDGQAVLVRRLWCGWWPGLAVPDTPSGA